MHYCTDCAMHIRNREHFASHGLHGNPSLGGCGWFSSGSLCGADLVRFEAARAAGWISYVLYDFHGQVLAWFDTSLGAWVTPAEAPVDLTSDVAMVKR